MCDYCDKPGRFKMCPCLEAAYCSEQCAAAAWDARHSDVCTFIEAIRAEPTIPRLHSLFKMIQDHQQEHENTIGARTNTRIQSLFEMLQDANQSESEYKNLFGRIYSMQRYNYITLHYDRCRKPIMRLDSRGDVSIAVLSSIQRLWRDYFGPWTGSRMAVLKLPPGFGKTAMGHLLWANYKYEAVQLPEVPHESENFTGPSTLPRMPIWITRPTLIHTVSEDLWAQDDQNPADIKQKITDNGGLVTARGTAFNKDRLVMSYTQFENILQGRSAAGRKLWAGYKLTDNVSVSAMETYNGVPTAFRRVDGQWVRGNASHDIDNTIVLRNIRLHFLSQLDVETLERIRRMIANDFDPIINQWKRYTWKVGERKHVLPLVLRKAIKNIAAVDVIDARTLMIVVRWKSRDPDSLPSVELWEQWVTSGFRPFAAYRTLQTHYKGELDAFAIHTEPIDTPTRGWKLGRTLRGIHASRTGREVLSWVPLEPGEREVDFNPLDRVMLTIDEAHNIFESDLIRAALKDSKNVVVVNMSASLDLFTGLRVLDNSLPNTENPSGTALGPARNFPTDLPHLSAEIRTYDELKAALTTKYFDPETNDFTPVFEELANAFKGVISVAKISEMRDIFAEAVYPERQRLDVRLSVEHAKRVHGKIMEALEMSERELAPDEQPQPKRHTMSKWVEPVQNTISLFTDDLHDRYNLASKTFRKEVASVAGTLIYGNSPVFPAAKVLLRKFRQLDEEEFARTGDLTKRLIFSSTKDHKYGIIPTATAMQAAGYEWLPVELQRADLAKLSTRARNRLRENRRLGVKIESQLRKVKIASEPMTIHSEGVELDLQPFGERKQFVVLSEELINRLLLASVEDPSFDSIIQDVLDEEPPSLRTAYKFHSTKGKFRQGTPDAEVFEAFTTGDAERSPAVEELLSRIMGKRLYLWPGYREEMGDWKSLQGEQMKVLLQIEDPQPFFFVRTQRSIIKLGKEIEELNITEEVERLALAWPREDFNPAEKRNVHDFNVLLGWVEPAKSLGEDTKKDSQDTILEMANEIGNIRGQNVRWILLGEGFLEGINVKHVTKVIGAEPAVTHASSLQRRGRAIRRCGHEGLPFEQWQVEYYTVVHSVPQEEFKIEATFFAEEDEDWPVEIEELPTQRAPKGESEEAKKKRLSETRARVKEEGTQRQFAFRQLSVLSSIVAEPVDWKTTPVKGRLAKGERVGATPILDAGTTLEPYQAVRMLHEDPRVTLVRLRGEQLFDEWALDRGHNTLRTKTTSTVRLNTNYMLQTEAVARLIASMDNDMQRTSGTTLDRLRERRDGILELLNIITESKTTPLIHREIAERDDEKTLYILLKNKTVALRGEIFTNKPPTELLRWLVAHNYAQWATVVEPVGASQLVEDVNEEESILVGSGIEDIGTPDEEQESIERATMANVFRILYALGIEWNLETTSLLWPETEQPEPDQTLGEVYPATASTEELRGHEKSIFQQLFADDGESVRSVPLKRVVKRAILDVYRYGVMNWFRGAALLAHVLRVRDTDKYWSGNASGDQASKTLTEAQLKRASTLVGTLFRLASAPDIIPYLGQLRALGIARHDNDFDQKAAIILASARWFDEIVIKRKASETKTKQGALGLPLLDLVTIMTDVQSLGINLNLHIDVVLEPLVRSPKAQTPYPTNIGELESQIRKKKPRTMLTTDTGEDANRLFQLYVKYDRNLTEAWEDISGELAKRNTILRALKLPLPIDNSTENVDQQIENIVTTNLEAVKAVWLEAQPYPAAVVVSALLRAFGTKSHFVSNSSNPARLERHLKALQSFMKAASKRLNVKTDELRKFLMEQKKQKKSDELQHLQNRPTRVTGFRTTQRLLNKTDGVGIERTERKATDVIPVGDSVPVEELLDDDGQRVDVLLVRIDPKLASEHKISGGLLQTLTAEQSDVINLTEMWVDDLVTYIGTNPLEKRFFERLTAGVGGKVETETKKKLAQGFSEKGIRKLIDELLKPDNNSLLLAIFTNRLAASFLTLLQFADVGDVASGLQILEYHSRLTDEFIEEFNGTTPVASLTTRINRFCNNCNLNDIKHLVVNPALYRNFPYYTQAEWNAQHGTGIKKGKTKKEDPKTLRSNANILRITVILYHEKTPDGGRYGSYRLHVTAIRRTVAKVSPELIHEKIPGQTMIDNPAFKRKSQVVNAAFQEAIRERSEKFLNDYQ